jgi:hypothetical protein
MKKLLLMQLPIPGLSWRKKTGNIPLAGACLKAACSDIDFIQVEIGRAHV